MHVQYHVIWTKLMFAMTIGQAYASVAPMTTCFALAYVLASLALYKVTAPPCPLPARSPPLHAPPCPSVAFCRLPSSPYVLAPLALASLPPSPPAQPALRVLP